METRSLGDAGGGPDVEMMTIMEATRARKFLRPRDLRLEAYRV